MNDKVSILIVDDEEVVRHSHLRSLADTGCHTEAAEDGDQALRVMEQHPFDVVLLDLRMPGMDDARAGVSRFHVAFNVVHDLIQLFAFPGRSIHLRFAPLFHVTLDTTNLTLNTLAMGRLGDVLVAAHTILLAVHAAEKRIGRYVQIALAAKGVIS